MWTKFTLRCVLCDHYATRDIPTDEADAFIAENAGPGCTHVCDSVHCADARAYGVGTMQIVHQIPLARVPGTDLHPMTSEHWFWITNVPHAPGEEDIPF